VYGGVYRSVLQYVAECRVAVCGRVSCRDGRSKMYLYTYVYIGIYVYTCTDLHTYMQMCIYMSDGGVWGGYD